MDVITILEVRADTSEKYVLRGGSHGAKRKRDSELTTFPPVPFSLAFIGVRNV